MLVYSQINVSETKPCFTAGLKIHFSLELHILTTGKVKHLKQTCCSF